MSSSSYAAWDKFDVERELERVDEVEKREVQQKQQQKQLAAKESVEKSVTQAAQQSADVLAAQAAVAALKAKKARKSNKETGGASEACKLQQQAQLFASKHALLQQILENRRQGDTFVAGNEKLKWDKAKQRYERALEATKRLEHVASELEKDQQVTQQLESKQAEEPVMCQDCRHGDQGHKTCTRKGKKKVTASIPQANDLGAIIQMFYKDMYVGMGTCELESGRLAAATEALKEVLLRDEEHLGAWLKRGLAFEYMEAPLLAMMHYNRITELDSEHEKGKEALNRVKAKLLVEGDAANDEDKIKQAIAAAGAKGWTFTKALEKIQLTFEEAQVLALEGFYAYSTPKFHIVIGWLEILQSLPDARDRNDPTLVSILQELSISCHLNIASGCLEIQREYRKGLLHCDTALALDPKRFLAHVRKGQLYHALHQYNQALACFEMAKRVFPALETEEEAIEMKKILGKAQTKCEFDRNHYDLEYIRTLTA